MINKEKKKKHKRFHKKLKLMKITNNFQKFYK